MRMNAGEGPVIGTKRRKKPKGKEKAFRDKDRESFGLTLSETWDTRKELV